jgi:tetratricopeptide (TPR) repeat protein
MTMKRRQVGSLLVFLAVTVEPALARADTPPTRWDRAVDPAAGQRYATHVLARELIDLPVQRVGALRNLNLERARVLLEEAGAATSPDVRLRFDLGEIYIQLEHYEPAIGVLKPALELAPRHPAAADAWFEVAIAYAKLDRTPEEREAYKNYLAVATRDEPRGTAMLNAAEAEMRLGHLDDAVAGYREAMAYAEALGGLAAFETSVLCEWGLAVALDRSGDPAGAMAAAKHAAERDPQESIIRSRNVFFVPEYDKFWYWGLGRAERAKQAADPRVALFLWRLTEQNWASYLAQGQNQAPDRWVALARAHLEQARTARQSAERRARGAHGPAPSLEMVPF